MIDFNKFTDNTQKLLLQSQQVMNNFHNSQVVWGYTK